jgi:hypothetical protein
MKQSGTEINSTVCQDFILPQESFQKISIAAPYN